MIHGRSPFFRLFSIWPATAVVHTARAGGRTTQQPASSTPGQPAVQPTRCARALPPGRPRLWPASRHCAESPERRDTPIRLALAAGISRPCALHVNSTAELTTRATAAMSIAPRATLIVVDPSFKQRGHVATDTPESIAKRIADVGTFTSWIAFAPDGALLRRSSPLCTCWTIVTTQCRECKPVPHVPSLACAIGMLYNACSASCTHA
jgi:hypothetical protein